MPKYSEYALELQKVVKGKLQEVVDTFNYSNVLKQSISYTVLNCGKLFRPTLLLAILDDLTGEEA